MEDLYFYFDDIIMGPDGEELYGEIMQMQKEFSEREFAKELNKQD